jgi:hypothetical protein
MANAFCTHFHIRWSSSDQLDYDRFDSSQKAEQAARQLVRHNETYQRAARCALERLPGASALSTGQ